MLKRAFSMIELVISIVIIGIVAASFPLILAQTSNNVAFAMQQEAILAAKTYMGTILSYPWDGNSIVETGGLRNVVLDTTGTDANSAFNDYSGMRQGHVRADFRRKLFIDPADNTTLLKPTFPIPTGGVASGTYASIDYFNGKSQDMSVVNTEHMDSIMSFNLMSTVAYVSDDGGVTGIDGDPTDTTFSFDDASVSHVTNIKLITIRAQNATADGPKVDIVLKAYSSNIGGVELPPKDYL
jgi:prepilin-type N-terminal cleavage/methylation domain-containing protein